VRRLLAWLVFLAALGAWIYGVSLIVTGDTELGLAIGVPAGFVLLTYAWKRVGFWLPDGGGGPWP
jgi:hypothetical protein